MKRSGFPTNQTRTIEVLAGTRKAKSYRRKLWSPFRKRGEPGAPKSAPPDPSDQPLQAHSIYAPSSLRLSATSDASDFVKTSTTWLGFSRHIKFDAHTINTAKATHQIVLEKLSSIAYAMTDSNLTA